jgi:hypothetical protein
VPDDVPDYDHLFLECYGMSVKEAVDFLYLSAQWIACNSHETKDLAHNSLVKVLDGMSRGGCTPPRNPKGYLYTILKNTHFDTCERKNRRSCTLDQDAIDVGSGLEAEFVPFRAWFWSIVDGPCFPRDCAEVIRRRLDRETCDVVKTWGQIATELGITRETASRRFFNGLRFVRQKLEDEGEEET